MRLLRATPWLALLLSSTTALATPASPAEGPTADRAPGTATVTGTNAQEGAADGAPTPSPPGPARGAPDQPAPPAPPAQPAPATGPTSRTTPGPSVHAPLPAIVALDGGDWDVLSGWLAARIANARAGQREIVRVPVVRRGLGWGCECPEHYLGVSTTGNELSLGWLALDLDPAVGEPPPSPEGSVLLAEGWFTGRTEQEDLRNDDGEPEEWLYTLDELHVARLRPLRSGDRERLAVVLSPPESTRTVEPLADGRPWVLVTGSAPLTDPKSETWAKKRLDALTTAGVAAAEALDSRRLPELWCCAWIVSAGRYATEEEAKAAAKALKKKGVKATVRRGF